MRPAVWTMMCIADTSSITRSNIAEGEDSKGPAIHSKKNHMKGKDIKGAKDFVTVYTRR